MLTNPVLVPVRFSCFLLILLAQLAIGADAQAPVSLTGYKLPTKELKLDARGVEQVLAAKTVALLASALPFLTNEDGTVRMAYRARRVGPDQAKADVIKVLSEWGAFSVVDDPAAADLVLVIEEQTLGPSFASDGKLRLRDTLAVFPTGGPGVAPPLWVGIDTENALAAAAGLTTPDAEGVVDKFRREVQNARNRVRK
jgi:hypothetical protein